LKGQHPCVELLLEYRKIDKQISAFINGWRKYFHKNNKMHPSYLIHGTKTGRLSCSSPNAQQTPKDARIRSCITSPVGYTFVDADYSQLELRLIAEISGDSTMKQIYKEGKIDLHTATASIVTGKPVDQITKKERSESKPINFGVSYGLQWRTLIEYAKTNYGITFTEEQAQKIRNDFFNAYPGLITWHERQKDEVHRTAQAITKTGRIRRLSEIRSPDKYVKAQAERQAINFVIQSLGADYCCSALIEIVNTFNNDEVQVVGQIHDAILFNIRNDKLEEVLPKIKAIMERPKIIYDKLKLKFDVPVTVEVSISPNGWGSNK